MIFQSEIQISDYLPFIFLSSDLRWTSNLLIVPECAIWTAVLFNWILMFAHWFRLCFLWLNSSNFRGFLFSIIRVVFRSLRCKSMFWNFAVFRIDIIEHAISSCSQIFKYSFVLNKFIFFCIGNLTEFTCVKLTFSRTNSRKNLIFLSVNKMVQCLPLGSCINILCVSKYTSRCLLIIYRCEIDLWKGSMVEKLANLFFYWSFGSIDFFEILLQLMKAVWSSNVLRYFLWPLNAHVCSFGGKLGWWVLIWLF